MREIYYTNKFKRLYKKLDLSIRLKVKSIILELKNNPFPRSLKVHKLSWKLYPYYWCSIDYDNRIIFEISDNNKITLLLVWDHSIYK